MVDDNNSKEKGLRGALRDKDNHDANKQFDEFTVFQYVTDTNLDHKAYDIDPIAGGKEEAIAANPLMAIGYQELQGAPLDDQIVAKSKNIEVNEDQSTHQTLKEADAGTALPDPLTLSAVKISSFQNKETQLSTTLTTGDQDDIAIDGESDESFVLEAGENPDNAQTVNTGILESGTASVAIESSVSEEETLNETSTGDDGNDTNDDDNDTENEEDIEDNSDDNTEEDNADNEDNDDDTSGDNPADDDGNNGHGNDADGVDDSNPGQGGGGPNGDNNNGNGNGNGNSNAGAGNNNGHGNNEDGVDDDNPGQGNGGPNAGKDDNGDEDEGALGNQGDDTPGADPDPYIEFFELDNAAAQDSAESWLAAVEAEAGDTNVETNALNAENESWIAETEVSNNENAETSEQDNDVNINADVAVDLADIMPDPVQETGDIYGGLV